MGGHLVLSSTAPNHVFFSTYTPFTKHSSSPEIIMTTVHNAMNSSDYTPVLLYYLCPSYTHKRNKYSALYSSYLSTILLNSTTISYTR